MGPTETDRPEDVALTLADIPEALALSTAAGWNQTEADWHYHLSNGHGFGIRAGGQIVGTAVALPYPPAFGWLSMVLVDKLWRGRGLATALMRRAVDYLLGIDLVPMLDATPAGRPVYTALAFTEIEPLGRWRGHAVGSLAPLSASDGVDTVAALDLAAFGANRGSLLRDIAGRGGSRMLVMPGIGYLMTRAGRTATHIGPLVATEPRYAAALLSAALDRLDGPLIIDVPDRAVEVRTVLEQRGFGLERPLLRMAYRRDRAFGNFNLIGAIAGPDFG